MSINISKIDNIEYKNLAFSIDKNTKENIGNDNGYLDSSEISIFCAKVNEKLPEEKRVKTFFDLAELLGFKKIETKANTREDYNLVKDLPNLTDKVTADNVVYLLTEYYNKNGKYCSTPTILAKLEEKATRLQITLEDKDKNVEILMSKIKDATDNTYFVEEPNRAGVNKIVRMGDAELAVSEIHYDDGRVVLLAHGVEANGSAKMLVTEPKRKIMTDDRARKNNEEAKPFNIFVPASFNPNVEDIAEEFVDIETKNSLMKQLNINNETYNKYARILTRIAKYECDESDGTARNNWLTHGITKTVKFFMDDDNMSCGTTAFKIQDVFDIVDGKTDNKEYKTLLRCVGNDDVKMKEIVNKYKEIKDLLTTNGIDEEYDLTDPKLSAIASVIFMHKRVEMLEWICENDSNKLRTCTGNHSLESRLQTGAIGMELSEDEVLAWIWKGGFEVLVDSAYTKNEKPYRQALKIVKYDEGKFVGTPNKKK